MLSRTSLQSTAFGCPSALGSHIYSCLLQIQTFAHFKESFIYFSEPNNLKNSGRWTDGKKLIIERCGMHERCAMDNLNKKNCR